MKRCLQYDRLETDETLKFCRVDGVPLVSDGTSGDESAATRILPTSPRSEAQVNDTGMVYAAEGKRAEALQIIKELEQISRTSLSQAQWIAKIYAILNEKEMTFSWLERGLATGAMGPFYKDEPVCDPIRGNPWFADLLRLSLPKTPFRTARRKTHSFCSRAIAFAAICIWAISQLAQKRSLW